MKTTAKQLETIKRGLQRLIDDLGYESARRLLLDRLRATATEFVVTYRIDARTRRE